MTKRANRTYRFVHSLTNPLAVGQQRYASGGRLNASPGSLDQPCLKKLLKLANL
jgi:hypothetical protein